MDDKELIRTRLTELDRMAYERGILKCSGFLSYAEQSEYHLLERSGAFHTAVHFLDGLRRSAERRSDGDARSQQGGGALEQYPFF